MKPSIPRRYIYVAVLLLSTLWVWMFLGRPFRIPSHVSWEMYSDTVGSSMFDAYAKADLYDNEPLHSAAIHSICAEKEWNPGLVFTCDWSVGGVGNVRNSMLSCLRYAIEAGGAMVMPRIIVRSADNIADIRTDERADIGYMFDRQHFTESLRISCPELHLYDTIHDIPNVESANEPIKLLPESIVEGHIPATGLEHPELWRETFYNWLSNHTMTSFGAPTIVELMRSYLQYPIYDDGNDFALNFGRILKFREDVRVLAAITVHELAVQFSLSINESESVSRNAFFGAHLRTEMDAVKGWPPQDWKYSRYDTQSQLYLEQASRSNASVIYVASGNVTEVARFADDARATGDFLVTTKFDLLKKQHLKMLNKLAWDQQGMVDFLVMLRATDFAGIAHSSFAWNIALRRHIRSNISNYLDGPQMLSDELSQIYGQPRGYPEYYSCMWP
ncbi:MAG: hypothetical protein M1818_004882 [Claussenomyces sp. TS43310]|nr:MAG: hypothetical protein M1818_004882 [Claussenomyces sp. TS43310]